MPDAEYYRDLSLADAVRRFAEHHFEPDNRHISRTEYELLLRAATALQTTSET